MKLSIFVVAYNQEDFIGQCLDSVLAQEIDFDCEILVGEDCSTDKTAAICDQYAAKDSRIKVFHHHKNLGLKKNWEFVWNHCSGDYIAMVEGDDYWIDTKKLQRQVGFLDAHPEFSLTFTGAAIDYAPGTQPGAEQNLEHLAEREYSAGEIYQKVTCLTSTVVCRNCLKQIEYGSKLLYADTFTFLSLLEKGRAYGFAEKSSAYRVHLKNISRGGDTDFWKGYFRQSRYFKKCFPTLADISQNKIDECLPHLIYLKHDGGWKYRFYKMWHEPKLFFSRFFIKTIVSYILHL